MPKERKLIKESYLKSKRQILKVPKNMHEKIKKDLIKKHGLKSYQELFDHLIVSGVVYLQQDIVALIDEKLPDFRERNARSKLARLGKVEAPYFPEYQEKIFQMYPKDYVAFSNFVVEKNCAKQWISEILFGEFVEENEAILNLINRGQKLDVRRRKNQISRLADDKWVVCLQKEEASKILEQLTESYDNRDFDSGLLRAQVSNFNQLKELDLEEEKLNREMEEKMIAIRVARANLAKGAAKPKLEFDDPPIDLG